MIKVAVYAILAGGVCGGILAGQGGLVLRVLLLFFLVRVSIAAGKDRIARRHAR